MIQPDAGHSTEGKVHATAPRDPAVLMRRAIRAVAAAERLLADSAASCERPDADLDRRRAARSVRASTGAADRESDARAATVRRADLRSAVDAYVCQRRAAGDAPDQVLARLKDLLGHGPTYGLLPAARQILLDDVVVWGIRAYHQLGWRELPHGLPVDAEGLAAECLGLLERFGVHALLARLNARTRFRFTGVYRFDPPRLQHLALYDRENPTLRLRGGTSTLAETCCAIVAETGTGFETSAVPFDARLEAHLARQRPVKAYQGVPLRAPDGSVWGTLCHYDLRPRLLPVEELEVLTWIVAYLPECLLTSPLDREGDGATLR